MNFETLERVMHERGINSLADISRALNTTPQAVSNWKSRNQVPYHIVNEINKGADSRFIKKSNVKKSKIYDNSNRTITLSDILLILAEQLKVILLVPFR